MGLIEAECFNAAGGKISIQGYNVHPGYAYGKMVNATRVLADVLKLFPADIAPETTQDHEGYYHPQRAQGSINEASVDFLLRDFDAEGLRRKNQYNQRRYKSNTKPIPGCQNFSRH